MAVTGDSYSNLTLTGNATGVMQGSIMLLTPPASTSNFNGGAANAAVVQGFTEVFKEGTGTWYLNNTNYWQGGTQIDAGTLVLNCPGNGNALSPNGPVFVNTNGTLNIPQQLTELCGVLTVSGGTVTGAGKPPAHGHQRHGRPHLRQHPGRLRALDEELRRHGRRRRADPARQQLQLALIGVTINGGLVNVGDNNPLGNYAINFNGGGLQFSAVFDPSEGGARSLILNAGGGILDNNGLSPTIAGPISGVGGLVKIGSGTLTLSGTNTYQGGTSATGGLLVIDTSTALPTGTPLYIGPGATVNLGDPPGIGGGPMQTGSRRRAGRGPERQRGARAGHAGPACWRPPLADWRCGGRREGPASRHRSHNSHSSHGSYRIYRTYGIGVTRSL